MRSLFVLILSMLLVTSCATTMPGRDIDVKSEQIKIALSENSNFSSKNIKMFQVSVKNTSDDWISIDSAFLSSAPTTTILIGEKISSWVEACSLEKRVSDYNMAVLFGSLAVAGAATAGFSDNKGTATTGAVIALGAVGAAAIKDYMNSKNKTEFQAAFPEGHIIRPFMIPPKKVIQRWILVENLNNESPVLTLTSKTKGIEEVSFLLK